MNWTPSRAVAAIIVVESVSVGLAVTAAWTFGGIPASRTGIVADLTLAATVLGFVAAVTTLIWAVHEAASGLTPPHVEIRRAASDQRLHFPLDGEGGLALRSVAPGLGLQLINRGPGIARIQRITAVVVPVEIRPTGWSTLAGFDISCASFPQTIFGELDLLWEEADYPGGWVIATAFALSPGQELRLPDMWIRIVDEDAAVPLIRAGTLIVKVMLSLHTDRGSFVRTLEIPVGAQSNDRVALQD